MLSFHERFAGAFVQLSPLLGIPVWAFQIYWIDSHDHADYDSTGVFFASGIYMLGAGLLIALIARFASRFPSVRDYAGAALRFQLIALAISVVLVVGCAIPIVLDSGRNFTMESPPAGIGVAVVLTGLAFGIVLPLIEVVRAIVLGVRAVRRAA
jgi:hypothetical protein